MFYTGTVARNVWMMAQMNMQNSNSSSSPLTARIASFSEGKTTDIFSTWREVSWTQLYKETIFPCTARTCLWQRRANRWRMACNFSTVDFPLWLASFQRACTTTGSHRLTSYCFPGPRTAYRWYSYMCCILDTS